MCEDFSAVENKLQQLSSPGIKPGLARLSRLLFCLGNPERKFKAVQVAGTNGKGSTSAMLASILQSAGLKTVLYTSPHLVSFGERLLLEGAEFGVSDWLCAIQETEAAISGDARLKAEPPTYFELTTAAAFLLLSGKNIDIAVVEAGLGGRLDATSMLKNVLLSLIVPIGMDHTEYLGETLSEIAAEKFAILRPNTAAIFAGGNSDLEWQFLAQCAKSRAEGYLLRDFGILDGVKTDFNGTQFNFGGRNYRTALTGAFQADNAALAIAASQILQRYFAITQENISEGLSNVRWQGRMEVVSRKPLLLFDGAHNSHAMKRVAENIRLLFKESKVNIVMAMMSDKDTDNSLELLKGLNVQFYCTEVPDMQRSMRAEQLAQSVTRHGFSVAFVSKMPDEALKMALDSHDPVLVCGSLYLLGWLKRRINKSFIGNNEK